MTPKLATLLALSLTLAGAPLAAQTGEHFAVAATIAPAAEEGLHEARVIVTELVSGEVVSAPRVLFEAGEEARLESVGPDGLSIEIVLQVDSSGRSATCEATMKRAEAVVGRQRLTLRLAAP